MFFGQFLESCLDAAHEEQILRQISKLSEQHIKGIGPAVANILYFIHPTLVLPFNTAMLRGFNLLFAEKKKLGSWEDYLQIRRTVLDFNQRFKNLLSNDLGAIAGMLYEVGVGEILIDAGLQTGLQKDLRKIEMVHRTRQKEIQAGFKEEESHTKIQCLLLKIGKSLGYDVIPAANDRSRSYENQKFSFISLDGLPPMGISNEVLRTIELIDVLWFEKGKSRIVCAFEIEKSTSIYSGILRLSDLALTFRDFKMMVYLVAPDEREKEIIFQLKRPSLSSGNGVEIAYILFSDLCDHCESVCKLGSDYKILEKITRKPSSL